MVGRDVAFEELDGEQQARWRLVQAAGIRAGKTLVDYLPFILDDERPCGHRDGELDERGMCIARVGRGYAICGGYPAGAPVALHDEPDATSGSATLRGGARSSAG